MLKLSKIERISQPPIFPDNNVETYFIPSSHSPKKNAVKNQIHTDLIKTDIPTGPIIPSSKLELDENLSFICEPIYKPSFFFSKKSNSNDDNVKEENNDSNDEKEKYKDQNESASQKVMIKSKSTDSLNSKKRISEKRNKKGESVLKNSIKDLRNCYDTSSKISIKKKTSKSMRKSNSSLFSSSIMNSSSTTLTRNSSYELEKNEPKIKNSKNTDKKKPAIKKPINYLRSNSKSIINTKSRYLLSSNSSDKVRKEKSAGNDTKIINKRKGNMNISVPLSISIPYTPIKKGSKPSSKSQKIRSPDSSDERKNVSSKGKSEKRKMKSIPLNISLSVSAPNINDENSSINNSIVIDGFDSSFCNNNFNNYDNNLSNDVQYCNPDNEIIDKESNGINKKNYIIENIIVNHENEQIFSNHIRENTKYTDDNHESCNQEQNSESEKELSRQEFFSNLSHNKMNYSSSETDKMYYYTIDDDNNEENKENKKIINKNINNVIQKSKKELLKKTGKNEDIWSIKSEPIDYSEKENKKSISHQKSILKKTQNIINNDIIYNDDEYNIAYDMPPDYSMIPSSPPHSENHIPSAPISTYEERYTENQDQITDEIMKETKKITQSIMSIKSLCSNQNKNNENINTSLQTMNKNINYDDDQNIVNTITYSSNNNYNQEYNDNDIKFINRSNNYDNNNNSNNINIPYNSGKIYMDVNKKNIDNENIEFYNQQLLPQQPMTEFNNDHNNLYKTNNIKNLQAAHISLNSRKLTPLYHSKYNNTYNMDYINNINSNIYQYNDGYNYNNNYRAFNITTTTTSNNNINNDNMISIDNNENKGIKKKHRYNRHMKLKGDYEQIPNNDVDNNDEVESLEDDKNNLQYKRYYPTRHSTYMIYTAGHDDHIVKLKIPKLDPKISYVPNSTVIQHNHPDLGKVKDVYNSFNDDHQSIEEPTNDNEFFQQLLDSIEKPKFAVTIVGYHPSSRLNFNYYNDLSMGKNWKMECTHMTRFKTPTFKIQINLENIVNDKWTEMCVDNGYTYSSEIPTFNSIINTFIKSSKPIKKIELMTKVVFNNRLEFESEVRKMFLSVGYYDKIDFIYHTSKSGVKIEKGKKFKDFDDNFCWTFCIWFYMWCIVWYPIMWCITGPELPPMVAYYQANVDLNILRCIEPLILEGASQQDLFVVTI